MLCHPDKNPDNPNAGKEFRQLTAVLEILTDDAARSAYDKVLKARKDAALRNKELDGKRRKLKEDLERREKLSSHIKTSNEKSAAEKLKVYHTLNIYPTYTLIYVVSEN